MRKQPGIGKAIAIELRCWEPMLRSLPEKRGKIKAVIQGAGFLQGAKTLYVVADFSAPEELKKNEGVYQE